jgi:hypothetical protein
VDAARDLDPESALEKDSFVDTEPPIEPGLALSDSRGGGVPEKLRLPFVKQEWFRFVRFRTAL